jgi:hypothetical protein
MNVCTSFLFGRRDAFETVDDVRGSGGRSLLLLLFALALRSGVR